MASKTTHFKGFSFVDGDTKVKLNLSRFAEQYRKTQYHYAGRMGWWNRKR